MPCLCELGEKCLISSLPSFPWKVLCHLLSMIEIHFPTFNKWLSAHYVPPSLQPGEGDRMLFKNHKKCQTLTVVKSLGQSTELQGIDHRQSLWQSSQGGVQRGFLEKKQDLRPQG